MSVFVKIKASERSMFTRKLVLGVGLNDAWYSVNPSVNGKYRACPVYTKWHNMLKRCYDPKLQKKHVTYRDCKVCDEWLTFSNFAKWYESNSIDGYQLDKDIKIKGNKIYSPETCLFIPTRINTLLIDCGASRGDTMAGTYLDKRHGTYSAKVRIDGKAQHIGYFKTEKLAREAYVIAKNEEIKRKCGEYPKFAKYLINHLIK